MSKNYKLIVLLPLLYLILSMITTSSVFASTTSDVFIVSSDSNAEVKTMELKAINENGEVRLVSGFAISIENVVSVEQNGKVTVFSAPTSPTFTSAKITDINDNTVDIPITDTGVISFAGRSEGVYTLDVIVDDRFAFECIVVIGPEEGQVQQQTINKQITEVNQQTDVNIIKKKFENKGINKERVCLFTPSHPICKPDPKTGKCPPKWSMNEGGQCFPHYLRCPPGYWRADDDESGACVPLPRIPFLPISANGTPGDNVTNGIGNGTDTTPQSNITNTTPSDIAPENLTQSDGGDVINETGTDAELAFGSEPLVECEEGEQLAADGLSCEPIIAMPIDCPEGEQLAADGLSCEPIIAEEPITTECDEGEELVDGQCQPIPTEEDAVSDEEISGDEGGGDEGGGDEEAGTDDDE